jgi:hypothetical protein
MADPESTDWRPLAWTGYLVSVMLLASLLVATSRILQAPVPVGGLQWRFSLMGFAYGEMPAVVLGWAAATLSCGLLGHRKMARVVAVAQLAFAVLLVAGTGFFVLDFLQIRPNINPRLVGGFDSISIRSGIIGLLGGIVIAAIARSTWAISHGRRGRPRAAKVPPAGGLVSRS